jgi:hypothetical protein
LGITLAILPAAANAQVTVRMANIRCEQYLAMSAAQSRNFSSWLSGWYGYKSGRTKIDLVAHEKNIVNLKDWCKYHPKETVMSGLDHAIVKD